MNFILQSKQRTYLLKKQTTFGASPRATIRIHTKLHPTFHATILLNNQRIFIIDQSNGNLFVNGQRTTEAFLFPEDVIEIGNKIFILKIAKTTNIDLTDGQNGTNCIDLSYNSDSESEISTNYVDLTREQNNTNIVDLTYDSDSETTTKYIDLTDDNWTTIMRNE